MSTAEKITIEINTLIFKLIKMNVKLHFKRKSEERFEFVSFVFYKLKSHFERCFFIIANFLEE